MLAAAMPLPREETTPPVTNMYFAISGAPSLCFCFSGERDIRRSKIGEGALVKLRNQLPVRRRIDAERFIFRFYDANAEAVFERAQLFQALCLFQGADGKIGIGEQELAAVDVEADVFEIGGIEIGGPLIYIRGSVVRHRA